jgi:YHS domain-containing protein
VTKYYGFSALAAFLILGMIGCGGSETSTSTGNVPGSEAPAIQESHEAESSASAPASAESAKPALSDDEKSEIAKLTEKADQDAALAQAVCPISGENLGSMGVPIKMTADGKDAYLCCNGCKKSFEKDPKAALAKLGK